MTSRSRYFLLLLGAQLLLLGLVIIDAASVKRNPTLKAVSQLTRLPSAAFATSHFEPRIRVYHQEYHTYYYSLPHLSTLDFVYAH